MNIAWIGTGVMGANMCQRLIEAGHAAVVHNRTRSKADPLVGMGAAWAVKPQAAAEQAEVVFTMVGHPSDVREVILGEEGALAGCRAGTILVDMTTSQPALAVEIAREADKRGVIAIDAPVSGGDVGAKSGALSIMIGGDKAAVQKLQPLWQTMGKTIVRHGGPGAGQHAKMVNQVLVGAGMVGICEALLYAHRAGLDLDKVIESTASGAAGSWALSNLAPRIIRGDFAPGFYVEHFLKDLGIILEECRRMDLKLPGVELAERLYKETAAIGHNRAGTQSLIFALAKLNGEGWKSC